ncbi:MAG: hypothetical protein ACE5GU_13050 [Candidatus Scalinduaceae bacterium]
MKRKIIPVKDIAEKLGKRAKAISEDIMLRIPVYLEFLKTLASIGKNVSLDIDKGHIKIKEAFVNDYLKEVSVEDKGLRSIKITFREKSAVFIIELKKFLLDGTIEIPFTVDSFIFSREKKTITLKFGDKKVTRGNNYYSKIILWFVLSILRIFYRKEALLKRKHLCLDSVQFNHDGTYTIELNKIPELRELFEKDVANIRYWDLITIDKLTFEKGMMIFRLSHKPAAVMKLSIGIIETLPAGRLIRPLVNRF